MLLNVSAGHRGVITMLAPGGVTPSMVGTPPPTVVLAGWTLKASRPVMDVTPRDVDAREYWPTHGTAIVRFVGFFDNVSNPGTFNTLQPLVASLLPEEDEANKRYTVNGWLVDHVFEVMAGRPNRIIGILQGHGDIFQTWT